MAEPLHGPELRVFRCLIKESQFESFDQICIELTHKPDHWRRTPNGYGVRRTLLGELPLDS
jgi:hypothetical protein